MILIPNHSIARLGYGIADLKNTFNGHHWMEISTNHKYPYYPLYCSTTGLGVKS
jgi:hypothetical protein